MIQAVRERRSLRESSQNYSRVPTPSLLKHSFQSKTSPKTRARTDPFSLSWMVTDIGEIIRDLGMAKARLLITERAWTLTDLVTTKSRSADARDVYNSKPQSASVARARGTDVTKPLSSKPKEKTYIVSKAASRQASSVDLDGSLASEHSESESILSTSTDYSYTETSSPKMSRKGSGGKGPMSMTRPNRAFALRRAKADSDSEGGGGTPRGTVRPGSAGRPTSAGGGTSSSRSSSTSGAGA